MRYLLFTISLLLVCSYANSQVIPNDRIVDWDNVIENMEISQPAIQLNVKNFGAKGDGITDDHPAIINAIDNLNGSFGYIYFPPGEYLMKSTISLPDSCILKGDGSENTSLLFDLEGVATNCISISKSQNTEFTNIIGGLNKGSNLITVQDADLFEAGDFVEIRQDNGSWDIAPISWAEHSVGQMTRIMSVIGDKLLIESALRIDYNEDLNPEVRPITPITNSGIECIKIKRLDEPESGSGANIYMSMPANCRIRGVESDTSVGAHVSIYQGLNILIEGNYFHHSFKYDGEGMRGYGVALSMHTSECLITNNIFRYLRHAMMIKTGANGNIFSYNYSLEPHRSEPIPDASGDISFHGHYAFSNLFEGNIAQNIVIDHYWGPSGPYNTLFRNRAALWGIIMTTNSLDETDKQNFVGNETTDADLLHGMYTLTGFDHFEYGNNILGTIIPSGTNNLPDVSYYLSEAPDFWGGFLPWPSVGIPIAPGTGTIPAKLRYESGQNFTICPDSIITFTNQQVIDSEDISVWPNPVKISHKLNIESQNDIRSIQVKNINGNTCYEKHFSKTSKTCTISTNNFNEGIYIISVHLENKVVTKKLIISKK